MSMAENPVVKFRRAFVKFCYLILPNFYIALAKICHNPSEVSDVDLSSNDDRTEPSGNILGFKRSVTNRIWHLPETEKIWQRNVKIWQAPEKIWQNLTKFWTVQIVCGKTAVRKLCRDLVKFCQILSNFYKLEAKIRQLLSIVSYVNLSSNNKFKRGCLGTHKG